MTSIAAFSALTLLVSLVLTGLAIGAAASGYINTLRVADPALARNPALKQLRAGFACAGVAWALSFFSTLRSMLPQVFASAGGWQITPKSSSLFTILVRVPEVLGIVAAILVVIGFCGLLRRATGGWPSQPGIPPQV